MITAVLMALLVVGILGVFTVIVSSYFATFANVFIAVLALAGARILYLINHRILHDDAYWKTRHLRNSVCPYCRYDIRGLPEPRCPECGAVWQAPK